MVWGKRKNQRKGKSIYIHQIYTPLSPTTDWQKTREKNKRQDYRICKQAATQQRVLVHIVRYATRDHTVIHWLWAPAWSSNWFKEFLNLRRTPCKSPAPEVVPRILLGNKPRTQLVKFCQIRRSRIAPYEWKDQIITLISSMKVIKRPHAWGRFDDLNACALPQHYLG